MVHEENKRKKGKDAANTAKSKENDEKVKLRTKRLKKKLRKKVLKVKLAEESLQNQAEIEEKNKSSARENKESGTAGEIRKSNTKGEIEENKNKQEIKESSTSKNKRNNGSGSENGKQGGSSRRGKTRKITNKKGTQKAEAANEEKKLGGLIFMCNSKTKPDCFRYKIMALPSGKKETVLSIKSGLKLFLYDYDLRLLYGIYEASSPGGMKLEPAAFGGSFPAQVRFRIFEDCSPLPERVFKTAIKESYDEKTHKFKMDLTPEQVRKLRSLFRPVPVPQLHSKDHFSVQQRASHSNARYLTEEEYRNYGLRPGMHGLKPHATLHVPTQQPYRGKQEEQMTRITNLTFKDPPPSQDQNLLNPISIYRRNTPSAHDQVFRNPAPVSEGLPFVQDHIIGGPQPHFFGENEYRAYGLRGLMGQSPLVSTSMRHESDLTHYREDQYHLPNHHPPSSSAYVTILRLGTTANEPVPYSTYSSRELPDYSQTNQNFGSLSAPVSAPVSSRYSFAGVSYSLGRNQL